MKKVKENDINILQEKGKSGKNNVKKKIIGEEMKGKGIQEIEKTGKWQLLVRYC